MNVVAIARVKNESDIIEAFVRHTLAWVQQFVLLDNGSTDGTLDILRALQRDGLPLHIIEDPAFDNTQWQQMTWLMHEYAIGRYHADWVIPLDADEFLMVDGPSLVPSDAGPAQPISLPWKTFVPGPEDDPTELNPVRRIRYRLAEEPLSWFKVMIPGVLARRPDAVIQEGNHGLFLGNQLLSPRISQQAYLAHFPGRNPGQLLAKIVIGRFRYVAIMNKDAGWGYHYRAPYELIRQDPALFMDSFREIVLRYTLPPQEAFVPRLVEDAILYRGGALTHTPVVPDRSRGFRAVLDYVDQLASSFALLSEDQKKLAKEYNAALGKIGQLTLENANLREEKHACDQEKDHLEQMGIQLVRDLNRTIATNAQGIESLHRSWTWQVGRMVVGPASWLKKYYRSVSAKKRLAA